jgi:hypothetical protein
LPYQDPLTINVSQKIPHQQGKRNYWARAKEKPGMSEGREKIQLLYWWLQTKKMYLSSVLR